MSLSRREFLQVVGAHAALAGSVGGAAGLALGGTAGAGCGPGCDGQPLGPLRPVECDGFVRGDAAATGHALRDGVLGSPLPPVGPLGADLPLHDVIVVGAGLSGLATTWALGHAGVRDVLVLERAQAPGGVALGGNLEGMPCPWGAHYIGLPDPRSNLLMHLLTDLGVIEGFTKAGQPRVPDRFRVRKPVAHVYLRGETARGEYSREYFPWRWAGPEDVRQARRFFEHMGAWGRWTDGAGRPAFTLPIAYASPAEQVRRLDRIPFAQYLDVRGFTAPALRWYVDNRLTDEYGATAEEISSYAAILFWAATGGETHAAPGRPDLSEYITWPEGNAFLVRGLARSVGPGRLVTSAWVVDVRNAGDEVHVRWWDPATRSLEAARARTCVFAAPKLGLDRVLPEWADGNRVAWSTLDYTPWLVANVQLDEIPRHVAPALAWDNLLYRSWSLGFINPAHLTRPPGPDPKEMSLLTFYASFSGEMRTPMRRDLLELGWDPWARLIVDELEGVFPTARDHVERIDLWRWGHGMVRPAPGQLFGSLRDELRAPLGRIFFAGNDAAGLPLYEEAVWAGVRAAEQAMDRLYRPYRSLLREPMPETARLAHPG